MTSAHFLNRHPANPRLVRRWTGIGAVAGSVLLSGCWVTERYIAAPEQLALATQIPAGETVTALPVHRYKKSPGHEVGKAVYLRADDLAQSWPEPENALPAAVAATIPTAGSPPVVVRSRRYSPVVTAGAVLTGVGSIISVAGTIVYFTSTGDTNLAGGIVALSAEPMMLAGTLMWIFGILRPPQEVSAGRAGVRYLEAAPVPVVPPPLPAPGLPPPAPALSLRF